MQESNLRTTWNEPAKAVHIERPAASKPASSAARVFRFPGVENPRGKGKSTMAATNRPYEAGIDPNRCYPFGEFCATLGLSPMVRKRLLESLQLTAQPPDFIQFSRERAYVQARAAWTHLAGIRGEVREELNRFNEVQEKRRERRRSSRGDGPVEGAGKGVAR
jgi:hypothetical protein